MNLPVIDITGAAPSAGVIAARRQALQWTIAGAGIRVARLRRASMTAFAAFPIGLVLGHFAFPDTLPWAFLMRFCALPFALNFIFAHAATARALRRGGTVGGAALAWAAWIALVTNLTVCEFFFAGGAGATAVSVAAACLVTGFAMPAAPHFVVLMGSRDARQEAALLADLSQPDLARRFEEWAGLDSMLGAYRGRIRGEGRQPIMLEYLAFQDWMCASYSRGAASHAASFNS